MSVINYYFDPEVNYNKTEALRRAGYGHPANQVTRFFTRRNVVEEIDRRRKQLQTTFDIGPKQILMELSKIGFVNVVDLMDEKGNITLKQLKALSREQTAAISELTPVYGDDGEVLGYKIKLLSKLDALDKIARNLGMFKDTTDVNLQFNFAQQIIDARNRVRSERIENNVTPRAKALPFVPSD